jgi:predicted phage baseplate assembly protein
MTGSRDVCLPGERRRQDRTRHLNGIESVVVDLDARTLRLRLLGKLPRHGGPATHNVRIDGPGRPVHAVGLRLRKPTESSLPDQIDIVLDRVGDRSPYTVRLVGLDGFDPRYAGAAFSFCPDHTCEPRECCCAGDPGIADRPTPPPIDYLAKDYASFRQLLLDRLSLVSPEWADRMVPDLGVTLVELLAYVGDQLSYTQDAVATEAYLETARLRTSIRRHLRLAGYRMHDGCNARAYVQLRVAERGVLPAGAFRFITALPQFAGRAALPATLLRAVDPATYQVFEPLPAVDLAVRPEHNRIRFWTWGGQECVLPAGTRVATLVDGDHHHGRALDLHAGDVLVIEEVRGPRTGVAGDADPRHRQAVRLVAVEETDDPAYRRPLLRVCWDAADALTFDARLSSITGPDCCLVEDVTVALGNITLADQGATVPWADEDAQELTVPLGTTQTDCCDGLGRPRTGTIPATFRPVLAHPPVTRATPFPDPAAVAAAQAARLEQLLAEVLDDPLTPAPALARLARLAARARSGRPLPAGIAPDGLSSRHLDPRSAALSGPAASALTQDPRSTLPQVWLTTDDETWTPRADLIDTDADDRVFVAEADDSGASTLRFGDGRGGRAVEAGQRFDVRLRTGDGAAGNVAADAIGHLVSRAVLHTGIEAVRNPLAAAGGMDPEPVALARALGPTSARFDPPARAIVAEDYATVAEQLSGVQDAAAGLGWNGAWYEAAVALDPLGRTDVPRELRLNADTRLHEVRRIGHDVAVVDADRIAVALALDVCLVAGAHPDRVTAELRRVLSAALAPDALRFGTDLAVSRFVALAMGVPGVRAATVTRLARAGSPGRYLPPHGVLLTGPLELPTADDLTIRVTTEHVRGA